MSTIADWLPMFPWEGPPLPRFLGFVWPWLQAEEQEEELSLPKLPPLHYKETSIIPHQTPLAYENKEEWEISWSEEGLPTKIVVHRKAVRQ